LNKAPEAFRTISEVAAELDLPQHVLRFWESRFSHIKPLKRGGGRRYYRREDVDLLRGIRRLLYGDGYTIAGVQRILREQGVRTVQLAGQGRGIGHPSPDDGGGHEEHQAGRNTVGPAIPIPELKAGGKSLLDIPRQDADLPTGKQPYKDGEALAVEVSRSLEMSRSSPATASEVAAIAAPPVPSQAELGRLTAAQIEHLKDALAALEACRRLLADKEAT
jgi:DNA-binding transcriptional MerR regulator